MRYRRESIQLFGMSFLDLLTCSLGAVLVLFLLAGRSSEEHADSQEKQIASQRKLLGVTAAKLKSVREEQEASKKERRRLERAIDDANERRRLAEEAAKASQITADTANKARNESAAQVTQLEKVRDQALRDQKATDLRRLAAEEALVAVQDDLKRAEEQQAKLSLTMEEAAKELAASRNRVTTVENQLAQTNVELVATQSRLRELRGVVGLRGKLRNVVFVFDKSASLGQSDLGSDAAPDAIAADEDRKRRRFSEYKSLLIGLVRTLDFDTFNVIAFDDEARVWTAGRMVLGTAKNREEAVDTIAKWQPGGTTNTLAALESAIALPKADTIVLFSDGQPNDENNRPVSSDPKTQEERLRSQGAILRVMNRVATLNQTSGGETRVVINTIAMGNYLDKDYGKFLQEIAMQNSGEFIGR